MTTACGSATLTSDSHEAAYLRLKWSTDIFGPDGFECRLQSADIQYTAFNRDGSPLRAEVTAKFVEAVDPTKKSAQLRLSSPALANGGGKRPGGGRPSQAVPLSRTAWEGRPPSGTG